MRLDAGIMANNLSTQPWRPLARGIDGHDITSVVPAVDQHFRAPDFSHAGGRASHSGHAPTCDRLPRFRRPARVLHRPERAEQTERDERQRPGMQAEAGGFKTDDEDLRKFSRGNPLPYILVGELAASKCRRPS